MIIIAVSLFEHRAQAAMASGKASFDGNRNYVGMQLEALFEKDE